MIPPIAASRQEALDGFAECDRWLQQRRPILFGRGILRRGCMLCSEPQQPCYVNAPLGTSNQHGMRALNSAWAGTMCTPWTSWSRNAKNTKKMGLAHPNTEEWLLWIHEVASSGYDMVGLENYIRFPPDIFADKMEAVGFTVRWLTLDSLEHGWSTRRQRFFGKAINQETLVFVGPDQENTKDDFMFCFQTGAHG